MRILKLFKNKYIITLLFLAVWVTFFDKNDLFSQYELTSKLKKLETERDYYKTETEQNKREMMELQTNKGNLEKFAREKYLMKKDNEDIFVIVKK
jgi:cell division protein FtsB